MSACLLNIMYRFRYDHILNVLLVLGDLFNLILCLSFVGKYYSILS